MFVHTENVDAVAASPPANQPASKDSLLPNLGDGGTCWSEPGAVFVLSKMLQYRRESGGGVDQIKSSGEKPHAKCLDASSCGKLQVNVQSQSFLPWKKFCLLYRF